MEKGILCFSKIHIDLIRLVKLFRLKRQGTLNNVYNYIYIYIYIYKDTSCTLQKCFTESEQQMSRFILMPPGIH